MKGHFTEVRFDATKNLGNYENEKVGVTFSMVEGDDVFEVIAHCRNVVNGTNSTTVTKEEVKVEVKEVENKKSNEGEAPKSEVKAQVETKEKVKKEKAKKVDHVLYDRKNDVHKARLGAFLDANVPNWKSGATIKKASEISSKFTGTEPFLDSNGDVLDSFKNNFLALMNE